MPQMNSHPAVFAGLLGSASWGVPTLAFASPLDDVAEAVAGSLVLQFVVGCAAGAVVAGTIAFVIERVSAHRKEEVFEDDDDDMEDEDFIAIDYDSPLDDECWNTASLSLKRLTADRTGDVHQNAAPLTPERPTAAKTVQTRPAASPLAPARPALERIANNRPAAAPLAPARPMANKAVHDRLKSLPVIPASSVDNKSDDVRWNSSSLNLMRPAMDSIENDPTGDLGRRRTGQVVIDYPTIPAIPDTEKPRHMRRPQQATTVASIRMVPQEVSEPSGRHFAASKQQERLSISIQSAPETILNGRHFASSAATDQVAGKHQASAAHAEQAKTPVADLMNGTVKPQTTQATSREQLRARLANLPSIESRYAKPARPVVVVTPQRPVDVAAPMVNSVPEVEKQVADTADDSNIAIGKLRLRDRVKARTQTVREVLAERLGSDPLEGVPMIQRADGTTVDVKASWFDQNVVPVLAEITGSFAPIEDTASRAADTQKPQASVADKGGSSRASYIASHVAEVNVGMFPERRSADELEKNDMWEEALAAMGDSIMHETPVIFQDVVGGPSTIDDPDGLEGPTGFVPFRVPSSHPEVVDTETYVDYLVRDELSHSGFEVIRRSPHAHLRVIEGTGNLRNRRRAGETGASPRTGRHFSNPGLVREA